MESGGGTDIRVNSFGFILDYQADRGENASLDDLE